MAIRQFKTKSAEKQPQQKFMVKGNCIIVKYGGTLPPRCIKCNKPTRTGIKQRVQWMPWWVRPFSIITRAIVGKSTNVIIGLCPEHHKKSMFIEKTGWFILLSGTALSLFSFFTNLTFLLFIGGIILFCIGMIIGSAGTPVKAVYMDGYMVKLKGCCQEFLNAAAINEQE